MKKLVPIITISLLVITASVGGLIYHYQTKTKYNESYVNGNTAGNLYNAGLFCESNGTTKSPRTEPTAPIVPNKDCFVGSPRASEK